MHNTTTKEIKMHALHVTTFPSGVVGFVGRVPLALVYDATESQLESIASVASFGEVFARSHAKNLGIARREFATEQAAREFAESRGFEVAE